MDFAKILELFQTLDAETVSLFMQFVKQAKNHSEGPNAFVKSALRKVVVVEQVECQRVGK